MKRAFYHYRVREEENGAAKRSRFNLVQDIDMLAAKFLAWTDTLALPQEDVPVVKGYILQKINVIFHALQQQPLRRPQGGVPGLPLQRTGRARS